MPRFPHSEYFLCTDSDLARHLFNMSLMNTEYSRKEVKKVKAEIERREKLSRNSLIREFRKKRTLSS